MSVHDTTIQEVQPLLLGCGAVHPSLFLYEFLLLWEAKYQYSRFKVLYNLSII